MRVKDAEAVPRPQPVAKVVGEIRPFPRTGEATGEPANVTREFVLTPSANKTLDELIGIYEAATGADLTRSHVLRAVLMAVRDALPAIKSEARHIGPLKRPSNARGCEADRDEFERQIAQAFKAGMRG